MAQRASDVISEVCRHFDMVLKDKKVKAIQSFMNGSDLFVALSIGYIKFLPSVFDLCKGE